MLSEPTSRDDDDGGDVENTLHKPQTLSQLIHTHETENWRQQARNFALHLVQKLGGFFELMEKEFRQHEYGVKCDQFVRICATYLRTALDRSAAVREGRQPSTYLEGVDEDISRTLSLGFLGVSAAGSGGPPKEGGGAGDGDAEHGELRGEHDPLHS
eukprot:RCo037117